MAKHEVKCPICGEIFDTNKIQAVRYGMRRYAHAACDPENTNFVEMESQKVKKEALTKKISIDNSCQLLIPNACFRKILQNCYMNISLLQ